MRADDEKQAIKLLWPYKKTEKAVDACGRNFVYPSDTIAG